MTLIIGFGNKARHGKDTAANAIVNFFAIPGQPVVRTYKYASALYAEVNEWLNTSEGKRFRGLGGILLNGGYVVDEGENFQELRSPAGLYLGTKWDRLPVTLPNWVQPDPNPEVSELAPYGKHPKLLQWWGTEYRRNNFGDDYWVKRTYAAIERDNADIALITDVRFPNEGEAVRARGGYTVNVTRITVDGKLYVDPSRPADHVSETAMDSYNWDYYIKSKSAEYTSSQAIQIVNFLKGRA